MVASRSARERKAALDAGPLARVSIDVGADHQFVHEIGCSACEGEGGRSWSTCRPGSANTYLGSMDRWIFHLTEKHAETEAPCLARLPEAQERLHERREESRGEPGLRSSPGDARQGRPNVR